MDNFKSIALQSQSQEGDDPESLRERMRASAFMKTKKLCVILSVLGAFCLTLLLIRRPVRKNLELHRVKIRFSETTLSA